MDILEFREFCMNLPSTEESMPFGDNTLVFKVGGKIYTMVDIAECSWINLKCDPLQAIELREQYPEITPGFHMNKKHWNTVRINGDLPEELIHQMIRNSYLLIVGSLRVPPGTQNKP